MKTAYTIQMNGKGREYRTYRVVTTSRLKSPRHLVVHDNLNTFPKYSERSVHNLQGLPQLSVHTLRSRTLYNCMLFLTYTNRNIGDQGR